MEATITNELVLTLLDTQGLTKTVEHLVPSDDVQNVNSVKAKVMRTKTKHAQLNRGGAPAQKAALTNFLAQPFVLPKEDPSKSWKK